MTQYVLKGDQLDPEPTCLYAPSVNLIGLVCELSGKTNKQTKTQMYSFCNTWTSSSQRLNNSLKVTQFRVTLALKQDFSCALVLASIPAISDFTPARRRASKKPEFERLVYSQGGLKSRPSGPPCFPAVLNTRVGSTFRTLERELPGSA